MKTKNLVELKLIARSNDQAKYYVRLYNDWIALKVENEKLVLELLALQVQAQVLKNELKAKEISDESTDR